MAEPGVLYCANHPTEETLLRCSKCNKPICKKCQVRTPVGIKCRDCAEIVKSPIYTVSWRDYILAGFVGLLVATFAAFVMNFIGMFLSFFLGAAVGTMIAEVISRVSGYKRGRGLQIVAVGCIILGMLIVNLPFIWWSGYALFTGNGAALYQIFASLNWIYLIFAIGAAIARLR